MDRKQVELLDREEQERIRPISERFNAGEPIESDEVFKHSRVRAAMDQRKGLVPSFDPFRITASIPFRDAVLFSICPHCLEDYEVDDVAPFLDSNRTIPILLGDYQNYPTPFVQRVISGPHISRYEYWFWRIASTLAFADKNICQHCVEEHQGRVLAAVDEEEEGRLSRFLINNIYRHLYPFVDADLEVLGELERSAAKLEMHKVEQLYELASTLNGIRTAQAFEVPLQIPLEILEDPLHVLEGEPLPRLPAGVDDTRRIAQEGLGILFSEGVPIPKMLQIVHDRGDDIRQVVDDMLDESRAGTGQPDLSRLLEAIAIVNDQVRQAEGSRRYKIFRATTSLIASNKALTAALLVAGALGFSGSLLGCGASVVGGATLDALTKAGKVDFDPVAAEFGRVFHRSLEPAVERILSMYLGLDLRVVQVWRIREELRT